jgi:hypothetical protein
MMKITITTISARLSVTRLAQIAYGEHGGIVPKEPSREKERLLQQQGGKRLDRLATQTLQARHYAALSKESIAASRLGYAIGVEEKETAFLYLDLFVPVAGVCKHAERRVDRLEWRDVAVQRQKRRRVAG